MKRFVYDLSCYNAVSLKVGHLQTVFNLPVVANDTISMEGFGALRLAQLKRFICMDVRYDIFGFFVPHRHVYDSDWTDMIKAGIGDTSTLDVIDTDATGQTGEGYNPEYLGAVPDSTTVPAAYVRGYNKIHQSYFRIPSFVPYITSEDLVQTGIENRLYGREVARLPAYWNTGNISNAATLYSGGGQNVYTDGTDTTIDLIDIKRIQNEFKDDVDKAWFVNRYSEIMSMRFGSNHPVNLEAEEIPELLFHEIGWLSGYDIDGTSGTDLARVIGKSHGMASFRMPPKYFPEGGMIWIMMCLRYPSILQEEKHYLATHGAWTYRTAVGDPLDATSRQPEALDLEDFTGDSTDNFNVGHQPEQQYFRTQNNRIHSNFWDKEGFPFIDNDNLTQALEVMYANYWSNGGLDFFENPNDLGHATYVNRTNIEARRITPPATASIYAGTTLD